MQMKSIEKKIEYKCRRFSIIKDIYIYGNNRNEYYYLNAPKSVAAIPVYNNKIILVEQYRTSIGKRTIELPGGRIEEMETPEEAVIREVREEIGGVIGDVKFLSEYYPLPSITTQSIKFYIADIIDLQQPKRDDTEQDMKMFLLPIPHIKSFLTSGVMVSAIEAIGLYDFLLKNRITNKNTFDGMNYLEEWSSK